MNYADQLKTDAANNARGHLATFAELYKAYSLLSDGEKDCVTIEGYEYDSEDAIRERAEEQALCVEVRSHWRNVGSDDDGPTEYRITLTCGGPSLEIIGDLDRYCQPTGAPRLMAAEMGAGRFEVSGDKEEQAALEWFCSIFYYGE